MTALREKKATVWALDPLQWYVEPEACTRALLRVERFFGVIHDPACGQGNIVRACLSRGHAATGSDVTRRSPDDDAAWWAGECDFLDTSARVTHDCIITNPPFFKAVGTESFIRRACAVAKHKVAIFTDIKFLAGGKRAMGLFQDHPISRVWVMSPRPSCPPGEALKAGNKASGGTADWCWLVIDRTAPRHGTTLNWLRILPDDHRADGVAA